MNKRLHFFLLTGWLVPAAVALVYFGRWITEIVIPTLKGGNFNQLYDRHQVKYLDATLACGALAFLWATLSVCMWAKRRVHATA